MTTVDEVEDCIKEDLAPKLALLKGPIKKLLDESLREMRANMSMVPEEFLAAGTPFIVPPELCVVPIFPTPEEWKSGAPSAYRWICLPPTYALLDDNAAGITPPPLEQVNISTTLAEGGFDTGKSFSKESKELAVPDGYRAYDR